MIYKSELFNRVYLGKYHNVPVYFVRSSRVPYPVNSWHIHCDEFDMNKLENGNYADVLDATSVSDFIGSVVTNITLDEGSADDRRALET